MGIVSKRANGEQLDEARSEDDADISQRPTGRVADLPQSYRRAVAASIDDPPSTVPDASIVLVTYHTSREEITSVLGALNDQTAENYEVVVVDNGTDWPLGPTAIEYDTVSAYVRLQRNLGVTRGRNLGARLVSSELVVFLDDDAVPASDFVRAHVSAHEDDVLGVRGRVLTTEDTFYNRRQTWYDLGDRPRPYYLNIEGNSSFDRETFLSVDGFDEQLAGRAGHEGIDITYRLLREDCDREQFIYHPDPVVYHDVDSDPISYLKKRATRRYYKRHLFEQRAALAEFLASYDPPELSDGAMSRQDRLLAHLFSVTSRIGCSALRLRDVVGV